MTIRHTPLLLLMCSSALLMTTGCTHPTGKAELRRAKTIERDRKDTRPPPDFRMTAMVLDDHFSGRPTLIDLTRVHQDGVPIRPYLPFRTNHDIVFSVRQTEVVDGTQRVHDYTVLLGPDPTQDLYAEGEMRSSLGRFRLGVGWAHFDGDLPVGETELVGTSARGTEMALRIRPHVDPRLVRHYVYNLESTGTSTVDVWRGNAKSGSFSIPPAKYVVITETSPWPPVLKNVDWQDPLVTHMQKIARLTRTGGKAGRSD